MSKVFRHVITGLVSILLDAIILKSRQLAQSRGGSAREKGRGRREGGGCELRSRLHRAADSRRRLLRYQYYRGRGESLEAAAPECSCTGMGRRHSLPFLLPSRSYRTPQPWHYCALTLREKAGANRRFPAPGRRGQGREEGNESFRCQTLVTGKVLRRETKEYAGGWKRQLCE